MSTARFWTPQLAPGLIELPPEEARHAVRSRRLSVEDPIVLFDGLGNEADAHITRIARQRVEAEVHRIRHRARPGPQLTLATALPKGPRQDVLIEKCTELGCAGLIPLRTRRSVAVASEQRIQGWRRTAIEAAKQSGQAWLPDFSSPRELHEILAMIPAFDLAWIAQSPAAATPGTLPWDRCVPSASHSFRILAFIGPEGGWEESELESLLNAGARPISLGPNTLRIETACMALAALMHAIASPPLQSSP